MRVFTLLSALLCASLVGSPALADSPAPGWDSRDIGAVGQPGGASIAGAAATVSGSGADIWGTSDSFHFASVRMFNFGATGAWVARVTSEQFTNAFAKAGIMLRKSYDPSSAHVILDVRPDGSIEFMSRRQDGDETTFIAGATSTFPVWLKLGFEATAVTAQISHDGSTWTTLGSTPFANTDIAFTGLAVTSHDNALVNQSSFDNIAAFINSLDESLPSPWHQINVGGPGQSGGASYSDGTLTISGSGADIWGTSDSFHFVYYQTGGIETQLTARVTGLQNTSAYAKAGVMFRESLEADAGDVILDVKPDGGVEFMSRRTAVGTTDFIGGTSQPAPSWLRLVGRSGVVSGYVSADGQSWQKIGEVTISWPEDTAYAGLAVTSHDNASSNTATFDNATFYFSQDIGDVGLAGSIGHANGLVTIKGAGGDIWGTADAFHFVSVPLTNVRSHAMTVRVRSLENTNPFAKAGLMVRESMGSGSAQVIVDARPDGSIEFMKRSAAGEQTTFVAGASLSFSTGQVWLELQYDSVAQTATAFAITNPSDRSSWIQLGPTTIALSPSASIGFAVTSHDPTALTTAVFDDPTLDP